MRARRIELVDGDGSAGLFVRDDGGFALHGPASKGAAVLYLKGQGPSR